MDNVIIIQGIDDDTIDISGMVFSMSLTNCQITKSNLTYPVDAVPSTLRFPFINEQVGGFHTPLEGSVGFDFTMALEMVRRDLEEVTSVHTDSLRDKTIQCKVDSMTSPNSESIVLMLDQEAQFLKSALAAIGIFGIVIITSFLWVGYKLIHKKKRRARIVDSLPREIRTEPPLSKSPELSPLRQRLIHETLNLVSTRDTPNNDEGVKTSPRRWYEDLLSPRLEGEVNDRDVASRNLFSGTTRDVNTEVVVAGGESIVDESELIVDNSSSVGLVQDEDAKQVEDVDEPAAEHSSSVSSHDGDSDELAETTTVLESTPRKGDEDKLLVESSLTIPITHAETSAVLKTDEDKLLMESNMSESTAEAHPETNESRLEANLPEHKNTMLPIKKSCSPTSSIFILELAEHIETSSSPFPKRSTPVVVTPEVIKNLSEKIRDPAAVPPSVDVDVAASDDDSVRKETGACDVSNTDEAEEVQTISEVTSPMVAVCTVSPSEKVTAPVHPISPLDKLNDSNDASSIADSESSTSLLVSLDSNEEKDASKDLIPESADELFGLKVPQEVTDAVHSASPMGKFDLSHEIDSVSSASLLVSVDGNSDIDSIADETVDDNLELVASPSCESKETEDQTEDIASTPSAEDTNQSKEKEMSTHNMKYNVIQELKSSSRFKFKQTSAASSFADELAVATGNKATAPASNDFASSLEKRAAKMAEKDCKTPVKKPQRKSLKPVDISPPPTSTTTEVSDFLSDYW